MAPIIDEQERAAALARLRTRAEHFHAEASKKKVTLICLRQILSDFYDNPEWLRPGLRSTAELLEEAAILLDRVLGATKP